MSDIVLSDAHLFQTYLEQSDAIADFQRVFETCPTEPEVYILAGDMFDYKVSQSTYLSHHRAEEILVQLRELFRDLNAPIYLLQGNHEKPVVLRSLAQTVENVHYQQGRQWISTSERDYLLLDTNYRTKGYDATIVDTFRDIASTATSRTNSALVMHETLGSPPSRLPKGAVDAVAETFDLVLNGHMHHFEHGVSQYGHDNVVNLPSLLPSRRIHGNWTERYEWSDGVEHTERESPFGYITLSDTPAKPDVTWFDPCKRIIDVYLNLTGLDIQAVQERFQRLLETVAAREDRETLIVHPILTGEAQFSPLLIDDLPDEFDELYITPIDWTDVERATPKLSSADPTTVTVVDEDLHDVLLSETEDISSTLQDEGIETTQAMVTEIIEYVTDPEADVFEGSRPRIADAVRRFVEDNAELAGNDPPANFETHLAELAQEVKD